VKEETGRPRGTLYLVGTPIGNLEDITLRALRVLGAVSLIAAEDTRHTRKLLDHYQIQKPIISYFEHNEAARVARLVERLQLDDVALVSDAGMPGISDPGYDLIQAALASDVRVVPVPGPSAPIVALAASGLPTDRFLYLGFLPRRANERRRLFASIREEPGTLVAFESPHRIVEALQDAESELGDRPATVARELTKLHEEFIRGSLSDIVRRLQAHPPRGEMTLLVGGGTSPVREIDANTRAAELIASNQPIADAAGQLARETGLTRRDAYRLLLDARNCAKM
jgi:16S rRNA (cytidine1402-2'-O)-methyltransferase